jgi:hypothetical protein
MVRGDAFEAESWAEAHKIMDIPTADEKIFLNIAVHFKFKKKGIARPKLVTEAFDASNTF